jgi:hypothetical protein
VDVTRSRCFPQPNGLAVGGIRLNIAGREPHGVLQPGSEAEDFIAWLSGALLEIIDERTGRPLVARVTRTADRYQGENLDLLPDLLVEWSDDVATGSATVADGVGARIRASSPLLGTVEGVNRYGRTGEHRPGGWFVAAGPGIAPGRLDYTPELVDLAPTFAAMLGVALDGCDGRPIDASCGPHARAERPHGSPPYPNFSFPAPVVRTVITLFSASNQNGAPSEIASVVSSRPTNCCMNHDTGAPDIGGRRSQPSGRLSDSSAARRA